MNEQQRTLLVMLIVVFTLVFHMTSFFEGHRWGGDFAGYIDQARAIVEGSVDRFRQSSSYRLEYSTSEVMIGPQLYPWGFPVLLAAVYAVFGLNLFAMKSLIVLFVAASQVLTYLLLRSRLGFPWVVAIVLMVGVNPWIWDFKNAVLSDVPFLFFTLLALVLLQRIVVNRKPLLSGFVDYALIGIAIFCAYQVRTHGLALLLTLAILQLPGLLRSFRGALRRGDAAIPPGHPGLQLLPYLVFFLLYSGVSLLLPANDASYVESGHFAYAGPRGFLVTVLDNIRYYAGLPGRFLGIDTALNALVIMPLAVFGALRRIRQDSLLLVFVLVHMAVLLVFPFQQGVRFILPIMPVYLYFAVVGVKDLFGLAAGRLAGARKLPNPAFAIVAAFTLYVSSLALSQWHAAARQEAGAVLTGPFMATSAEAFAYLRANTEADAVVVFWKPRVLMLMTGRRSVLVATPAEVFDGRAGYLMLYRRDGLENPDDDPNALLGAIVARHPQRFAKLFANGDFAIYRIAPAPG